MKAHVWGIPGCPPRLLDLDATIFLAFMEGIIRESEDGNDILDRLYAERSKQQDLPESPVDVEMARAKRRAEIARFAQMTSGEFQS